MENQIQEQILDSISTRDQILSKSLEIINDSGMVSFRIDTLATALDLSPGNITYHFSRKEDISVALWEAYLEEYFNVEYQLTNLLDLKQLFLLNRINMQLNYKYRGVLIFRSADQGAMTRDKINNRFNEPKHHVITNAVLDILQRKGYLISNPDKMEMLKMMEKTTHYIFMRWSINLAYHIWDSKNVEKKLDHLALLCLYSIYPLLSEKGKTEFMDVAQMIQADKLMEAI